MGQWRPSQDHKPTASPCALWWEVALAVYVTLLGVAPGSRELARAHARGGTKRADLKKVDVPRLCVVCQLEETGHWSAVNPMRVACASSATEPRV